MITIMTILTRLFLLSKAQNCMSMLSAKENQKLSKLLRKGFEISVYWNEYKTKREIKNTTNEDRYFFKSNFVGVKRLFVLVYPNQDNSVKKIISKGLVPKDIIYEKVLSRIIMSLSIEKTIMTNPLIQI